MSFGEESYSQARVMEAEGEESPGNAPTAPELDTEARELYTALQGNARAPRGNAPALPGNGRALGKNALSLRGNGSALGGNGSAPLKNVLSLSRNGLAPRGNGPALGKNAPSPLRNASEPLEFQLAPRNLRRDGGNLVVSTGTLGETAFRQKKAVAAAQKATKSRDNACGLLENWMSDLHETAKAAFRKAPEQARKLDFQAGAISLAQNTAARARQPRWSLRWTPVRRYGFFPSPTFLRNGSMLCLRPRNFSMDSVASRVSPTA